MNKIANLLVALCLSMPIFAQEDPFETVITPAFSPVTWERLVNAGDEPENWLMYSGTLDSQRYSKLDQINTSNVATIELKWAYQIPVIDRAETVPLVVDGIMFITEAPSNVVAVDAAT
ncbi:MAG: PQQ-dependent dehydrogenase, methanol/ethanol family, partial [Proteobacteria bacterium]|nr:PQQ-dependent dehydrogenase, methanol/ethanol family [Pseudomonadota bacterium]